MKKLLSALSVMIILADCSKRDALVFYLSPEGDDSQPGTLDAPIATFRQAGELIRQHADRDIRFYLRGGTYVLDETVVISKDLWPGEDHTLEFTAYQGETPVIFADREVTGWTRVEASEYGLPPEAAGRVWIADIPEGVEDFNTLYYKDEMLPRARSEGCYPTVSGREVNLGEYDKHLLHFPDGALKAHKNMKDVEIAIVPSRPWIMNLLPLESVDTENNIARTSVPGTYPLAAPSFGHFPDGSFWVENAPEVLDTPGEWVVNTMERKILLWPLSDKPEQIVVPKFTEYIRVEGDIHYDEPEDTPVFNVHFRGITFTRGDRFDWEPGKTGRGLQHDWEMFDRPTAMVRFRGAENCIVDDCEFVQSGGTAIRLDLHCKENKLINNTIGHTGGAGILLAGYGPGTKDVNKQNLIINNHIHHTGQLLWHSAGIFAWQSGGNTIRNNLIHHTPYIGLIVSGRIQWDRSGQSECSRTIRWHEIDPVLGESEEHPDWYTREPFLHGRDNIVEKNEIHHAMQILGDGNCIYISGTGKGNLVQYNYLHDNVSPSINANIRCDDDQHLTIMQFNLITNSCGEGFISKGNNTIRNNIIYNLMSRTPGGIEALHQRGYLVFPYGNVDGSVIKHNIFYAKEPGQRIMTEGCRRGSQCAYLRDCQADSNLYFNQADPDWAADFFAEQRAYGVEKHSMFADPQFRDPANTDFTPLEGSPALGLGFVPFILNETGLLDSHYVPD